MTTPLNEAEAAALRRALAKASDAVEARIRGDVGSPESVRRAAQDLQIEGMGAPLYWGTQLWQPIKNTCLMMTNEMNLLPLINEAENGISAKELAEKIDVEQLLVVRLMRVLTCVGICEEVSVSTYKPNQLSRIAASNGGKAGIKIGNELLFPISAQIVPYMRQSKGYKMFPRRPEEQDPTQYTYGGRTMWQYFKDTPEAKHWFDTLMEENRAMEIPWHWIYPIDKELTSTKPEEVLLVDVGGNRGADILEFKQAIPNVAGRVILQDLPETIDLVDKSTFDAHGIELQPYDFFTEQPVQGARFYFWRWILHDWDDESIRKFLPNTVKAMSTDSKLLLEELVLPEMGWDMRSSHTDILMSLLHSGIERSLSQWEVLINSCGLEIIKIHRRPDTEPCIIECKKKAS